jgi:hypothetical protein
LVVGTVCVRVGEVGDDREAPVAVTQSQVVSDRVAEGAGAVQVQEGLLGPGDGGGVLPRRKLDEDNVPDHAPIFLRDHAVEAHPAASSVTCQSVARAERRFCAHQDLRVAARPVELAPVSRTDERGQGQLGSPAHQIVWLCA